MSPEAASTQACVQELSVLYGPRLLSCTSFLHGGENSETHILNTSSAFSPKCLNFNAV